MKIKISFCAASGITAILLASCSLFQEQELSDNVYSGVLTIQVLQSNTAVECAAEAFMKKYPDVQVEVLLPSNGELTENFLLKLKSEIMSGQCADLISANIFDMETMGKQNDCFVDLNEMMEEDGMFNRADYFENVFDAYEIEGRLYQIPFCVEPVYIKLNQKLLDSAGIEYNGDTIGFYDILQIYKDVCDTVDDSCYIIDYYNGYEPFFSYELGGFVRNHAFGTQEHISYLEANVELEKYQNTATQIYTDINTIPENVLCRSANGIPLRNTETINSFFEKTAQTSGAILYENIYHEIAMTGSAYAISSFSEQKQLAWEFMKFCLGEQEIEDQDYVMIPLNKEKAKHLAANADENVVNKLWNGMERINAALYSNVSFGVAVDSIYQDYYTDHIISSEECSQMLAERLYIAINE